MAKRQGEGQPQTLAVGTLFGVAVLLLIAFVGWRGVARIDRSLGERLGEFESRLDQAAARMERTPAPRRGPNPDRVYAIRTDGSPSRGKEAAPVTIAEFSDFQ
jgi:hypothetical protein